MMNNTWARKHLDHYRKVAAFLQSQVPVKMTVLVGRPEEVLDSESFSWKSLEDKEYPREQVTRATYFYPEADRMSFISVILNSEEGWAHGVVLTTTQPLSSWQWLNMVSVAECAQHNTSLPGNRIHKMEELYS